MPATSSVRFRIAVAGPPGTSRASSPPSEFTDVVTASSGPTSWRESRTAMSDLAPELEADVVNLIAEAILADLRERPPVAGVTEGVTEGTERVLESPPRPALRHHEHHVGPGAARRLKARRAKKREARRLAREGLTP